VSTPVSLSPVLLSPSLVLLPVSTVSPTLVLVDASPAPSATLGPEQPATHVHIPNKPTRPSARRIMLHSLAGGCELVESKPERLTALRILSHRVPTPVDGS
jgi:hypothetical protein